MSDDRRPTSPSAAGGGTPAGCTTAPCPLAVRLEIVDAAGTVLTGTQTRIVGERIDLTVRTNPAGHALSNIQWTLPGDRIKDYTQAVGSAAVTNLTAAELTSASVQFYWFAKLTGGNVQVSANVDGAPQSASVSFNVLAPTAVSFTGEQCATKLGPHFLYPLGVNAYDAATGHFGIQWNATCTAPAGGAGEIAITQLITRNFTRTRAGVAEHITSPAQVLDDGLGIQYSGPQPIAAGASATLSGNAYSDSPGSGQLTADITVINCNDQFIDFFMYKPSKPNAIWVTLSRMTWSWSGAATKAGPPPPPPPPSGFVLGAHTPAAITTQTGSASTALPQWTANLAPSNNWTP